MAASGPSPSSSRNRTARGSSDGGDKSPAAYRTIGEVAEIVGVPPHVLRFWETRFSQLRPLKRSGNRRYYRPEDVALLQAIRVLLHEQGLTIRGVQKRLREEGVRRLVAAVLGEGGPPEAQQTGGAGKPVMAARGTAPAAPAVGEMAEAGGAAGDGADRQPASLSSSAAGAQGPGMAAGQPDIAEIMERLKRIRALLDVAAGDH